LPPAAWTSSTTLAHFYGEGLKGWAKVVEEVHAAGGKIIPQLWHVGTAPHLLGIGSGLSKGCDDIRNFRLRQWLNYLFSGGRLKGWAKVVEEVHAAGGKIIPQLWHVGTARKIGDAKAAV
jgi:2,4-dienoyl-CoA reductase-like NADH-dependent reductase (Old Yellow Enzyme family)